MRVRRSLKSVKKMPDVYIVLRRGKLQARCKSKKRLNTRQG